MIMRLVEGHYFAHISRATGEQIDFWFQELRTPRLLIELAASRPERCTSLQPQRPLLSCAAAQDEPALHVALREEEDREREADRTYWQPLRKELERLRALHRNA